jgi:fluoride ion exporter CrcB/FEX
MIAPVTGSAFMIAVFAAGGGAGSAARAAIRELLAACGVSAAWVILGVNLVGAALAGAVLGAVPDPESSVRMVAVAFLSGWTTYSAFSTDFLGAVREGRRGRAAALWLGTIGATPFVAGLAARIASGAVP